MNIDQTTRSETAEEGEDLVVEELFIEDYGSISAEEPVEAAPVLERQAGRVKSLVMRAPKRSLFVLVAAGLIGFVLAARARHRHVSALSRLLRPFRYR